MYFILLGKLCDIEYTVTSDETKYESLSHPCNMKSIYYRLHSHDLG